MDERDVRSPGVGPQGAPTAQPQGVAPQEEATAQPQGVEQQEPTATGEAPPTSPPAPAESLNLDDVPEFRKWKSAYDQRMSQAEQRAREAEERAAQVASRLEELELRNLRPDEREAWYKTKLAEQRETLERQQAESARRQQYVTQAGEALEELGLKPDTPGLDWGDGPSEANFAKLMRSAARIVAEQSRQTRQTQAEQTEDQVRQARHTALREAGVTRTSVATDGATPDNNPIASISDPIELLRMGATEEQQRARGRQPPRG